MLFARCPSSGDCKLRPSAVGSAADYPDLIRHDKSLQPRNPRLSKVRDYVFGHSVLIIVAAVTTGYPPIQRRGTATYWLYLCFVRTNRRRSLQMIKKALKHTGPAFTALGEIRIWCRKFDGDNAKRFDFWRDRNVVGLGCGCDGWDRL